MKKTGMNLIQIIGLNHIAHPVCKQGTNSEELGSLPTKLPRGKSIANIAAFNVITFNTINQRPELTIIVTENDLDILCFQKHTYDHSELEVKYQDTRW